MDSTVTAHKQADQDKWYLTAIAELAMEGIIVVDLSGVIQFINMAWAAMHGYEDINELIGKRISLFYTKEQMETDVVPFIEEVKRRGRLAGPLKHVRRNGIPFPAEMLMVLLKDQMGKALGLICFATDMTKQKRTEEELKQYRCNMEKLVDQRTEELEAANSRLQSQVTEHEQASQKLMQQTAELSTANEQLREQIVEQDRLKDELEKQRDNLEQRLKQQSEELTAAEAQLKNEIARRKKEGEYSKRQSDAIKAVCERLRTQIGELSTRRSVGESEMLKTTDLVKAVTPVTIDENAILEKVFHQNIMLQKPKP